MGFEIDNSFLVDVFGPDAGTCFPQEFDQDLEVDVPAYFSGSIQLYDFTSGGRDSDHVATFWFNAFSKSGDQVQYALDLYDDGVSSGWSDDDEPYTGFPPEGFDEEGIGDTVYRSVTRWESRVTKKNVKNGCTSGGLVEEGSGFIDIVLQPVESNPYY